MSETELTLIRLNRFPVKGLSAEPLFSVRLVPGEGIPGDRLFGFARYNSGFDPHNPKPIRKERFVVLATEAGLASLRTRFDASTRMLEIETGGSTHVFDMRDGKAQRAASTFLYGILKLPDPEPPQFVSAEPHRFTDVSVVSPQMMNAISVLNLASVRELGRRLKTEIDPARFRANLVIDGMPPFAELDAVDDILTFGEVTLRILSRTRRCAATEVNPETASRDLRIPLLLHKEFGHSDMGVYAEVTSGGTLQPGQKGGF